MSEMRRLISWLLLALVAVVGLGFAVLGIALAPKNAPLEEAATNTLSAPNYTQILTEKTTQGDQSGFLVWQAPNRLGGYVQSDNKRTYVYVLPSAKGPMEYLTKPVAPGTSTANLTFYRQPYESAALADPTQTYLRYAKRAKVVTSSGNTYTFTLTQTGSTGTPETGKFVYKVNGAYVSQFNLTVANESVQLVISAVGSSPAVSLPAGAKVVVLPATSTPST
jgi:hypothetical protein